MEHFCQALTTGKADAALAATLFHYNEIRVGDLKKYLADQGVPIRMTGLSEATASWKTIPIRAPRTLHISFSGRARRSLPSRTTLPPVTRPGSTRRITASPVADFPHPDSPTRAYVSPRRRDSVSPSTARTTPREES